MFDDLKRAKKTLKAHTVNGKAVGGARKYVQPKLGVDGDTSKEIDVIIPSRTLPPTKPYVYGATEYPLGTIPGPYSMESKPIENYGRHRSVWEGWRPERPTVAYDQLGAKMPTPGRNYKYESDIPEERELVGMSIRNATAPYPTVTEGQEIPDPSREYGMYVEGKAMSGLNGLGQTGQDVTGLAKDIAAGIQAKYGAQIEKYKSRQAGLVPPAEQPASAKRPFPMKTAAAVIGIGIFAVFVLPKILK